MFSGVGRNYLKIGRKSFPRLWKGTDDDDGDEDNDDILALMTMMKMTTDLVSAEITQSCGTYPV